MIHEMFISNSNMNASTGQALAAPNVLLFAIGYPNSILHIFRNVVHQPFIVYKIIVCA